MKSTNHVLYILVVGLLCVSVSVIAQDPVFSQYQNAPIQLNPAMAGNNTQPFIAANVRVQWPGLANAYNTYALSYDQFIKGTNSGIGLSLLNDSAGDGTIHHTKVGGVYSYNLRIKRDHYVRGGIELGLLSKRIRWSKLQFGDALDPQFGAISPGGVPYPSKEIQPSNLNSTTVDLGVGIVYYSPFLHVGLAVDHLVNPRDEVFNNDQKNFLGIPQRITLHAGTEFKLNNNKRGEKAFLSPNILLVRQGSFSQINFGANLQVGRFLSGLSYRFSNTNGDAIIFAAGFRMGDVKMMYSFDLTTSGLSLSQGGAHELGFVYNMFEKSEKKYDINDCMNIFR